MTLLEQVRSETAAWKAEEIARHQRDREEDRYFTERLHRDSRRMGVTSIIVSLIAGLPAVVLSAILTVYLAR